MAEAGTAATGAVHFGSAACVVLWLADCVEERDADAISVECDGTSGFSRGGEKDVCRAACDS
jgi:hypothetical protein